MISPTKRAFGGLQSRIRATSLLGSILIAFSVLSISVISYVLLHMVQLELRREATTRNTVLASTIAHEIAMTLEGYTRGLTLVGSEPFLSRTGMAAVKDIYSAFEYIEFSNPAGRIQFTTDSATRDFFDISKREYYIQTNAKHVTYVSDSFISERTYQPTAVIAVPVPGGIVAGHLNLQALTDYITGIERNDFEISVVDRTGYYIAHSRSDMVYRRETVALEPWYSYARDSYSGSRFNRKNNTEYFTCWANVNKGNWLVVINQTTGSIFKSADRLRRSAIGITLVFVFLSVAMIIVIIRLVSRDINALVRYSRQMIDGKYDISLHFEGFADLMPLAQNFEEMFAAVRSREENLLQNESLISANLREKEVLLKEIHHRVKNNLQLVISLLSLKAGADDTLQAQFADSIDRIRVMSMIHEMLYRSEDLAQIDLAEYMRIITEKLLDNFTHEERIPALSINLQSINVDIDTAIPCGLIINELLTNSLKYAFTYSEATKALLTVQLSLDSHNSISLFISDNGPGLPPGFDPTTTDTLGMQLVLSLVDQLGGAWKILPGPGTVWLITFPGRQASIGKL